MSSKSMQAEKKFDIFNSSVVLLCMIVASSLVVRLYFSPFGIPLTLDAQSYFWYASDASILGKLPQGYTFANNGWPVFLAPIFAIFKFDNMIAYMDLQRMVATLISVLTVIPVYFLCRRFVKSSLAIFGAAVFAFEPRLIQNSLFGLNDSLYVLIGSIALVLFLRKDMKSRCVSFVLIGLGSIVRSEGLFFFFALSIMYFVQYRKNPKGFAKYGVLFAIFVVTILPMAILRIELTGTDALTGRIINEAAAASVVTSNHGMITFVTSTLGTFFGFLARVMLPIFVFFVPVGAFLILKNRNFEKNTIIVVLIVMSIPALYAYSVPALDTKYFYFMYPAFCVLSVLAMDRYDTIIKRQKILIMLAIFGIIIASVVFLAVKMPDRERELEYYRIAEFVVHNTKGVNEYYPESKFISAALQAKVWPSLKSSIELDTKVIPVLNSTDLNQYILDSKEKGLTHIVIDDVSNRPPFLIDVFNNEEKYPYLVKVFDSKDHRYKHHVKIFKIDYEKFELVLK